MSVGPGDISDDLYEQLHVPRLKQPPAPFADNMKAFIQSDPPLGQVTQITETQMQRGPIILTAVLEVPCSRKVEPWQVALWHATDAQEWTETLLERVSEKTEPHVLQAQAEDVARLYFSGALRPQRNLEFTLKFRHDDKESWRWTKDELGIGDGSVIVSGPPAKRLPNDLGKLFKDLNPAFEVKVLMSQCPGTQLWSLNAEVPAEKEDQSFVDDYTVGTPCDSFKRWFALIRTWTPWLAPRQGTSHFELDRDGVLCSFLSPQGYHMVLLALSGINNTYSVFRSNEKGEVVLHVRNDATSPEPATILAAVGDNFDSANAAVMYHVRNLVQITKTKNAEWQDEVDAIVNDVKPEWRENWYDGLGYCTWNGLGQQLTEEKIFDAVDKLADNKIKVASLIIDDNWQSIDYRGPGQFQHGWLEFEAEPKAFPGGLKQTVSHIREKHPHIHHIAVWHALLGYWAGISPDGKLAKDYKTVDVVREDAERRLLPLGGKMTVIAKEDIGRFYDDFYKFLSSCGVDGVKTDAQFIMDLWKSPSARRELTEEYLDAWTISSLRHFSIKAISCMSQVPEIMFYSQVPRNRPPVLCRNSDDFFPHVPESHPWHVWTNAHNTLLTQHLNTLPDWDMFQTMHEYSGFHAAARCVSGGPIYITDVPGEHNIDLIKQMTGLTVRGKTVIFRPSVLGKTLDAYNSYHEDGLLRIGTYHGRAVIGTPIVGMFNVSSRPLLELLPLRVFPGVLPSMHYVVRAHTSGRVTPPIAPTPHPSGRCNLLTVSLDTRGYEIFTAFPLESFDSEVKGKVHAANLGLLGKMTGAAAIVSSDFELVHSGRVEFVTSLKALGVLGVYISKLPELNILDDFIATIQGQVIPPHTVSVSKQDEHVLEVDVEKAWEEMALHPGWANEVEVKMNFSVDHEA